MTWFGVAEFLEMRLLCGPVPSLLLRNGLLTKSLTVESQLEMFHGCSFPAPGPSWRPVGF